ncbi:MAG: FHA domain-containing protein, partial [Phycisphaerae bacterium]|nr:FHA domain-containing protein [Phycisphaerae bacterium]
MATLQIIRGPDKERSFNLVDGDNVVGRQGEQIQISDGTISRRHAMLTTREGRWFIEDLGAANGTYLNGVKVTKPIALTRGDQIRLGSTLLVFADTGQAEMPGLDVDEEGNIVDAAIMATIPSNEDSVIMPSPEAGVQAIGNLRILYELINDVGSVFDIDLLLRQTLDKVFDVLKADRGYVLLLNEAGNLVPKASRVGGEVGNQEIPISRTIIDHVLANKVGVLSSNAMGDKRFTSGKSVHDFGIRSAVCVPIPGREKILGVIHVDASVSEHTYTTEQLRLLTAIGYQTGMAIENVEMHKAAVQSERLAAVGETVAFLSHHIKNILQALDAGVDVVEAAINRDDLPAAKKSWPIVERSLGRINGLILNMLTFSKDREPLLEP